METTAETATPASDNGADVGQQPSMFEDTAKPAEQPTGDAESGKDTPPADTPKEEPKEEPKQEEPKKEEEPKEEDKEDEKKEEDEAPTRESLGYGDVDAIDSDIVDLAVELGISKDKLKEAVDFKEGTIDTQALGLTGRDALFMKQGVRAAIASVKEQRAAHRAELESHVGGSEAYEAITDFAKKKASTDTEFAKEFESLRGMLYQGGSPAKLAMQELQRQFTADPNTTKVNDNMQPASGVNAPQVDSRQALDKEWDNFSRKYK